MHVTYLEQYLAFLRAVGVGPYYYLYHNSAQVVREKWQPIKLKISSGDLRTVDSVNPQYLRSNMKRKIEDFHKNFTTATVTKPQPIQSKNELVSQ